jgi:hypothetical protein
LQVFAKAAPFDLGGCSQGQYFEPKMAFFENRIAEYLNVFEKRKRKKNALCRPKDKA